jgi:hypothetical protein
VTIDRELNANPCFIYNCKMLVLTVLLIKTNVQYAAQYVSFYLVLKLFLTLCILCMMALYGIMSISTGLHPTLDSWNVNKLHYITSVHFT